MAEATQIAGNVLAGVGSYEAGKYNRDAAYAGATGQERAGNVDEARIAAAARQTIGAQVAAQGANGFQQGTGSALDDLTSSQINAAMDALNARQAAENKARALRAQGDVAYAQGKNALVAGMLGAASAGVRMNSDWASARAGQTPGGGAAAAGRFYPGYGWTGGSGSGDPYGGPVYGGGPNPDGTIS